MLPGDKIQTGRRSLKDRRFLTFLSGLAAASLLLAACGSAGASTNATLPPAPLDTQAASTSGSGAGQDVPTVLPAPVTSTAPAGQDGPTAMPAQATSTAPQQPAAEATTGPNTVAGDASAFPDPNAYQWVQVAGGLLQPVGLVAAGDGSGRLFIIEKRGVIQIIQNNQVGSQGFLDITDRVGSGGSEQGLLGLAFDPQYTQNGRFYVNYTGRDGNTVISRFTVTSNAGQADPGSEHVLIRQDQPFANHNGGQLAFGPDGFLYMGLGDGGSAGDPNGNGQSLQTQLGKILRIDVKGDAYSIPVDNPFAKGGGLADIWAYGLRNPWRFSFDMKTHDLFIADVGQDKWEEIDFLPAGTPGGTNFGWNYMEATHAYQGQPPAGLKLTGPVFEYDHGQGCSVSGGYVYRGSSLPAWQGIYLFGDFCSGRVWGLLHSGGTWQSQELFDTSFAISSFGQDETGEVYLVDINGNILRLAAK